MVSQIMTGFAYVQFDLKVCVCVNEREEERQRERERRINKSQQLTSSSVLVGLTFSFLYFS